MTRESPPFPSIPSAMPAGFNRDPASYLAELTSTPAGEIALLEAACTPPSDGPSWYAKLRTHWIKAVQQGRRPREASTAETAPSYALADRPLVQHIIAQARTVLVPQPDNFTPPARTPWGGTRIPELKRSLGVADDDVVGESWEISGHPSFPNTIATRYADRTVALPLWLIGSFAPQELYGPANVAKFGNTPPFLTKLLNSGSWKAYRDSLRPLLATLDKHEHASRWCRALGKNTLTDLLAADNHDLHAGLLQLHRLAPHTEGDGELQRIAEQLHQIHTGMIARNLSIQIHPDASYAAHNERWHSKTEMWVILGAEEGAGLYLGLKPGVTEQQMTAALDEDRDVSDFLNFVKVAPGDIFFIPAGTPHAIGAGVLLLEQQETSETTFRYFSWWDGRQLHVQDAVACTHWDAPRGEACINSVRRMPQLIAHPQNGRARHELLAAEEEFSYDRVSFEGGDRHRDTASAGMQGVTVTQGRINVESDRGSCGPFVAGQSFIIPAQLGAYMLRAPHGTPSTVYIGRSDTRGL